MAQGPVSVSYAAAISVAELSTQLAGRKTDEGFAIFNEDELGINAEAGGQLNFSLRVFVHISLGTPSCPFDCSCCKSRVSVPPGNE